MSDIGADSSLAPSQWEMLLQSNAVSGWTQTYNEPWIWTSFIGSNTKFCQINMFLMGQIKKWSFSNPHTRYLLDVTETEIANKALTAFGCA